MCRVVRKEWSVLRLVWSVVCIMWCMYTQVCTTQHTFECSHSTQLSVQCNVDKCKSAVAFTRSPARIHRLCHAPSDTGHRCACLRWTIIVILIPIIIFIFTIVIIAVIVILIFTIFIIAVIVIVIFIAATILFSSSPIISEREGAFTEGFSQLRDQNLETTIESDIFAFECDTV